MRKKIIEALKTKYKNLGFSDKAFDGVAAYLETVIKEEADIETACNGVEGLLKVFQGEGDSIRTARSAAEKKLQEMEAKIKELTDDKSVPTPPAGGDDTPAWAKALIDANKALAERMNKMDSERTTKSRRQKLDEVIKDLPDYLRKSYNRYALDKFSDDEFENMLTEVTGEVSEAVSSLSAKGAVFNRPAGNGGKGAGASEKATDEEVNAVVSRLNI